MLIIPAIDLKDGACVRLRQGDMENVTVFGDDPLTMADRWINEGCRRIHLVDLDGAVSGQPMNADAVRRITSKYPELPVQIGGGIRNLSTIETYLNSGVSWVIIGTKAVTDWKFFSEACQNFPAKVIVGIDARDGFVATDGWTKTTNIEALTLAQKSEQEGVSAIIYTDIMRDGMMQGVNVESTQQMAKKVSIPVIASGGITDMSDIRALKAVSHEGIAGAIAGRAIYEGTLSLLEAQRYCDE